MTKNNAKSTYNETDLDNGFLILELNNNTTENQLFERDIDNSFIQLHFCLEGKGSFLFNNGTYNFDILNKRNILLYNPQQKLPINLNISPNSVLISVLISIEKFHSLFSNEAGYIPFLSENNKNKKYYDESPIKPKVLIVLQEIFNTKLSESVRNLYIKGKIYELISLYFQQDTKEGEVCPYLIDEQEVLKIRKAKDIIIKKMANPPSLQELANEVGLNLKKLKEGFKQVYGDTVFSFLLEYKMVQAKKMLDSKKYNVNEVGLKLGYSTSSHFITAFKKKYKVTPKQYLLSGQMH